MRNAGAGGAGRGLPARAGAAWRGLVGPLDRRGSALVLGAAVASGGAVALATRTAGPARAAAMGAVAFDLMGGLVAFQLPATRRRYAATSAAARLGLAAAHIQPFVVPVLGLGPWWGALRRYATVLAATAAFEAVAPASTHRPAAARCLGGVLALADLAATRGQRQRWLGPVLLVKLVAGHAGIVRRAASRDR